jgi:hypothetical protein
MRRKIFVFYATNPSFSTGEASRKYIRLVWELDKILSQRPETSGHVWSISCLLGALENEK